MLPLQIDEERFALALEYSKNRKKGTGIGTLSEKLLHATFKKYFLNENGKEEEPVGPFVADILDEDGIIEIQTGSFSYLRKKLEVLLPDYKIRVILPLMREKTIFWIDPTSGSMSKGRKSPKTGEPCHLSGDLLSLLPFFDHPNLELYLFIYDGEEYRLADGYANEGKRGSHRVERVPLRPVNILGLFSKYDFGLLLPKNCPLEFTSTEYSKISGLQGRRLSASLKLLTECQVLTREKCGRKYKYQVREKEFCIP